MNDKEELFRLAGELESMAAEARESTFAAHMSKLESAAERIGKSWSGSWLGYHSRVYYKGFEVPPPGARFSQEWGFNFPYASRTNAGDWEEHQFDEVVNIIKSAADDVDPEDYSDQVEKVIEKFDEAKSVAKSKLQSVTQTIPDDKFLSELYSNLDGIRVRTILDFTNYWMPSGQYMSRDMQAIQEGQVVPPHLSILAAVHSLQHPYHCCQELGKLCRRAASHLDSTADQAKRDERIGTKVFIGHGQSTAWRELKDFVQDRLHLPWDEFNRVPIAGVTNVARLAQMLDDACGYKLANDGHDTRAIQHYLGHRNITHTCRYTELAADRFNSFWQD